MGDRGWKAEREALLWGLVFLSSRVFSIFFHFHFVSSFFFFDVKCGKRRDCGWGVDTVQLENPRALRGCRCILGLPRVIPSLPWVGSTRCLGGPRILQSSCRGYPWVAVPAPKAPAQKAPCMPAHTSWSRWFLLCSMWSTMKWNFNGVGWGVAHCIRHWVHGQRYRSGLTLSRLGGLSRVPGITPGLAVCNPTCTIALAPATAFRRVCFSRFSPWLCHRDTR